MADPMAAPATDRDEFSQACQESATRAARFPGNIGWGTGSMGCIGLLVAGSVIAILIGTWTGLAWLGVVLFFVLPPLMLGGGGALLYRLSPDTERARVVAMIDAYVADELEWNDCPNYLMMQAVGLPHGNTFQTWLNCDTGQLSAVERTRLERVIERPENHALDRAASVRNGLVSQSQLSVLRTVVAGAPLAGKLRLEATVIDGMPFTLKIVRGDRNRVCEGNLAGLPQAEMAAAEAKAAEMLLSLSHPDVRGTASCGKGGEISVFATDGSSPAERVDG